MSLDLNKLSNKLDEALSNETSETLTKFLNDKTMSNNKQSMKLYTEEELTRCDSLCINCDESESTHNICMDCIIKIGKENIQLPTDDEIIGVYDSGIDRDTDWIAGAIWMRNKIQGGNNEQQ